MWPKRFWSKLKRYFLCGCCNYDQLTEEMEETMNKPLIKKHLLADDEAIADAIREFQKNQDLERLKNKLQIGLMVGTDVKGEDNAYRGLQISMRDETEPIPIGCFPIGDVGVSVDATLTKPGRYTLNMSYAFEVKEETPMEAKLLILDKYFAGMSNRLTKMDDGSWSTDDGTPIVLPIITTTTTTNDVDRVRTTKVEIDESIEILSKVSLVKQFNRMSSFTRLVEAKDVTDAADQVGTLDEVADIMGRAGLKSANLIFGVDFTASNRTQGLKTFSGKSLHHIDPTHHNPYQKVISILGKTLQSFSDQQTIPAFGFGDVSTSDLGVFSLQVDDQDCKTFEEVLQAYNTLTPKITPSGPTNFAPIIRRSIKICKESPSYYLLVIVADGQVNNEKDTVQAIVEACQYPISIVVVGVGDGPWEMMDEFDQRIPERSWDNFNFVNFHLISDREKNSEVAFAVHALSEIPDQFATISRLGLLSQGTQVPPEAAPEQNGAL